MVVTLQPFLVKFTRFLLNNHKTMTMLKNPSTTMRRFFFLARMATEYTEFFN